MVMEEVVVSVSSKEYNEGINEPDRQNNQRL